MLGPPGLPVSWDQKIIYRPRHGILRSVTMRLSIPDALDSPKNTALLMHIRECKIFPRSETPKGIRRQPQSLGRCAECPDAQPMLVAAYWTTLGSWPVAVADVGALLADHRVFVNAIMTTRATSES